MPHTEAAKLGYPFLCIAKDFDVSYGDVLVVADYVKNRARSGQTLEELRVCDADYIASRNRLSVPCLTTIKAKVEELHGPLGGRRGPDR